VLDSEAEPLFDKLAQMASRVCGMPVALISLLDDRREWIKAKAGLDGVDLCVFEDIPRDIAFSAYAIASSAVIEVADASADARLAANPLVTSEPLSAFTPPRRCCCKAVNESARCA